MNYEGRRNELRRKEEDYWWLVGYSKWGGCLRGLSISADCLWLIKCDDGDERERMGNASKVKAKYALKSQLRMHSSNVFLT